MTSITAPSEIDEAQRLRIAQQLTGRFQGAIIGPDHAEYAQARLVWNGMIDKQPGLILRCTSTADVVAAIDVARSNGIAPAVRGGGHNVAGKAMSEGGLTIDLGGLRQVYGRRYRSGSSMSAEGACSATSMRRPPRTR